MSLAIFGLSPSEMIGIAIVALLLFGGRLPDVARSLGRSFTQFKRGLRDIEDDVETAAKETDRQLESKPTPVVTTHKEREKETGSSGA